MNDGRDGPRKLDIPHNWDVIRDGTPLPSPPDDPGPDAEMTSTPPTLTLLAASWADAVTAVAVCTAALLGLTAAGHPASISALPWAAALGGAWWLVSSSVLVLVRRGTPGMLLAGVMFGDRVAPRRLVLVVAAAAVQAALLGMPGFFGARRSPLAAAAASSIKFAGV